MRPAFFGVMITTALAGDPVPRRIADINALPERIGMHPSEMVAAGGRVFYTAQDPMTGQELWVTDGTPAGTRVVRDLRVGVTGSMPYHLRAAGSRVFFFADDGEHGLRLWSSGGADMAMAGVPGPDFKVRPPRQVVAAGDYLYFTDGPQGAPHGTTYLDWNLWASDGSDDGMSLLNPYQESNDLPTRPFLQPKQLAALDGQWFSSA